MENIPSKWTNVLNSFLDDELNLKVGNFQQSGLFHYVEEGFLTENFIKKLESAYARRYS